MYPKFAEFAVIRGVTGNCLTENSSHLTASSTGESAFSGDSLLDWPKERAVATSFGFTAAAEKLTLR